MDTATHVARVLDALKEAGLLLQSDAARPSVAALVAGSPVRGSWWGHPEGPEIYRVLGQLDDDADALATRLVDGKVTYVHRRLWPALVAVAQARAPWQLAGLDAAAAGLLQETDAQGELPLLGRKGAGDAATALERRLLVVSRQVHTEAGHHARILTTWSTWRAHVGLAAGGCDAAAGRAELEAAAGPDAALPWRPRQRRRPPTPTPSDRGPP